MKPLYVSLKPFLDHAVLSRPVVWQDIFQNNNPIDVEIGIGNGEYLAGLAQENPQRNFVGFEEYCERVSRSLRKLSRVDHDNVKVLRVDVRPAFNYLFAPRSIDNIYCLFPPPWPKKSDIKHRLMQKDFLKLANSRLKEGGTLKIVTDFKPYADWVSEQIDSTGFDLAAHIIPARYNTKFEKKWAAEGQSDFYELLLKKQQHIDRGVKEDSALQHYFIDHFNPDNFKMDDYAKDNCAVVFREYLYDAKKKTAQVYTLVHDEHLLQHVRIMITEAEGKWRVNLAAGSMLMPTPGIAKAIECVKEAAAKSV